MQIHLLGTAAGGGVPQWNCNCRNCQAARAAIRSSLRRTQSSVAVSSDGKRWILLNASPDLPSQFASFAAFAPPKRMRRGSPVEAVVLTDGELDHVTGILSLREQTRLRLASTPAVATLLSRQLPILSALSRTCQIERSNFPVSYSGLQISALDLPVSKAPSYARRAPRRGDVVALRVKTAGRSLVYMPCLPAITEKIGHFVAGCDCLLLDGTFWSNDEMISLGLTRRTGRDMGHVPISGADGSLAWLRRINLGRTIYIHINNTNPILRPGARERGRVEQAGIEIGYDGLDIRL
jgi:pyrroloquinoline quinone biosynthesis protein B